jgi:hypothetical protein
MMLMVVGFARKRMLVEIVKLQNNILPKSKTLKEKLSVGKRSNLIFNKKNDIIYM